MGVYKLLKEGNAEIDSEGQGTVAKLRPHFYEHTIAMRIMYTLYICTKS